MKRLFKSKPILSLATTFTLLLILIVYLFARKGWYTLYTRCVL
jgi:hypothetical protein